MPENEQFPEPLSEEKTASRLRNQLFPESVNLKGKGYIDFPLPIDEKNLEEYISVWKNDCAVALSALKDYKREGYRESLARKCIAGLFVLSQGFYRLLKHPVDIDRLLEDAESFQLFRELVKGIKESGMVDSLESSALSRNREIAKIARKYLMEAEIYLASSKLSGLKNE